MTVIPATEAWVHEPQVQYQLKRAAKWMKETPRCIVTTTVLTARSDVP